jgi:hypothetical protein
MINLHIDERRVEGVTVLDLKGRKRIVVEIVIYP